MSIDFGVDPSQYKVGWDSLFDCVVDVRALPPRINPETERHAKKATRVVRVVFRFMVCSLLG